MTPLTLKQANLIIEQTITGAHEMKLPPIGVAVLDSGGHLKALQIEDGLAFLRIRVCHAKAWGSLGLGMDSAKLGERYLQGGMNPGFIGALNAMCDGQAVPLPGGVLIHDAEGQIIGAVGVSGAAPEDDEKCAKAGLKAAGWDSQ